MIPDCNFAPTVAVTGLDARENPYPGLAIARSLRADPGFQGRIIALTYDIYCTGQYRGDIFDAVYVIPYPSEPEGKLLCRLMEIHKTDPMDLIMPALDSEIAIYTRLSKALEALGIHTLLPSEAAVKSRYKDNLSGTCRRLRIRTPKTLVITHMEQLYEPLQGLDFPLVIKGSLAGAAVVNDREELKVHYLKTLKEWGFPVLLQEKLIGEEYDICALADRSHRVIGHIPIKKFAISSRGKASSGIIVDEPYLGELAQQILERMRWIGPCELELLKETATGRFFLLEINARFPAWIYLGAEAGCNLPSMAVRTALNMPLAPDHIPETGKLFFRNRFGIVVDHTAATELLRTGSFQFSNSPEIIL
jgi:carbamoyl-phosphate synthase large subunit